MVTLANRIVTFIITIMVAIAVVLMAIAGFRLVTAGSNQGEYNRAKDLIKSILIGIIIILAAWLIIDTVMRALLNDGGVVENFGPWNEVQCSSQVAVRDTEGYVPGDSGWLSVDAPAEDTGAVAPASTGSYGTGVGPTCNPGTPNFPACAATITTNGSMNPIFDCSSGGCSSRVQPGAEQRMQETLNGPFATLQQNFGRPLVINDALAKDGTSRETETPNSRHFYGDAIDISLAGMSNADRIRLFNEAQAAGFTGFGFGNNILHIDRGGSRGWAYGNSTYGGQDVDQLINQARN